MTESEWLTCTDPTLMLQFLRGRVTNRKLRLFACACCRRLFHPFQSMKHLEAVGSAEEYADGHITAEGLNVRSPYPGNLRLGWPGPAWEWLPGREQCEIRVITGAMHPSAAEGAEQALQAVTETGARLEGLLRCVFGNPFHKPAVAPKVLVWQDGTVVRMAHTIYAERRFGELPILADALEDAGCNDARILSHCRDEQEHVRGCWVLDLLRSVD